MRFYLGAMFAICLATVGVYGQGLWHEFVNWDDMAYVPENYLIRDLSTRSIGVLFNRYYLGNYHPLTLVTYAIEYALVGPKPWLYVLNNIILHLANTWLVSLLIWRFSKSLGVALAVAGFFALHPLRVESVIWISERKDVLYTLFFLGSILSYDYYLEKLKSRYLAMAVMLFLISLLCKAMAMTLPAVLVLVDVVRRRPLGWKMAADKIPFAILTLIFGALALDAQRDEGAVAKIEESGRLIPLLFACKGLIFYVHKTIYPANLACIYPTPFVSTGTLSNDFLIAPVVLALVGALWLIAGFYRRSILAAGAFYIITVSPVIQLVPVGMAYAADRYSYVPGIGLFLIGIELFRVFCQQLERRFGFSANRIAWSTTIVLLIACSIASIQRGKVWKNSEILWTNVIQYYPHLALPYGNRAHYYLTRGRWDEALADCNAAIERNPNWKNAYASRAQVHCAQGNIELGLADLDTAIQLDPLSVPALNNRAFLYSQLERWDEAFRDVNKAIELNRNFLEPYRNRASMLKQLGRLAEAKKDYEYLISVDPKGPDGHYSLASILDLEGKGEVALGHLEKAAKLAPRAPDVYLLRGAILLQLGRLGPALADFDKTIVLAPGMAEAHSNRGNVLLALKRYEDALAAFTKSIQLQPAKSDLYLNRGYMYEDLRMTSLALADFDEAIKHKPSSAAAHLHRGMALATLNKVAEAKIALEEAKTLGADPLSTLQFLAVTYAALGDYPAAWKVLGEMEQAGFPVDPAFRARLAKDSGK